MLDLEAPQIFRRCRVGGAPQPRREPADVADVVALRLKAEPAYNPYTHLPTAWDYSGPLARRGFWTYLGDATLRTWFGLWWLCRNGIRLPMQWNMEENGLPDGMFSIKRLSIDSRPDEASLTIPPQISVGFAQGRVDSVEDRPLGDPTRPPTEVASGIVLIPGAWNVTIVRQEDGLVILEAPISSGYSAKVLGEARRRFPGLPVKAVVTTSDSWPHIAGIREYVANGIPVYVLDLNRPMLDRVVGEGRVSRPDLLASRPRPADIRPVGSRMTIGTGENRIELYPIRGETSERQMMAYFPGHRLLYGSDPFQRDPAGPFFIPQTVSELVDAVTREHLAVDRFFMMHLGPTAWGELRPALDAAAGANTPDGRL